MKKLILLALLILPCVSLNAQEKITLAVPVAQVTITDYSPQSLSIVVSPPSIMIGVSDTTGKVITFIYPCNNGCVNSTSAQVATLINNLNTANLTTRSLWRRIFDRLLIDFPEKFSGGASVN